MEEHRLPCQELEWSPAGHWRSGTLCQIWNQDERTNGRWRKPLMIETWCRGILKGKTLEEEEEDSELIDDWLVGCWLITRPNECLIGH